MKVYTFSNLKELIDFTPNVNQNNVFSSHDYLELVGLTNSKFIYITDNSNYIMLFPNADTHNCYWTNLLPGAWYNWSNITQESFMCFFTNMIQQLRTTFNLRYLKIVLPFSIDTFNELKQKNNLLKLTMNHHSSLPF